MTKIVLKINCRDSNPSALAENQDISGLLFSLNILLVFETLSSQRKIMFCLFHPTSLFSTINPRRCFSCFSVVWKCNVQIALTLCMVCIHLWHSISSLILCFFNEKIQEKNITIFHRLKMQEMAS